MTRKAKSAAEFLCELLSYIGLVVIWSVELTLCAGPHMWVQRYFVDQRACDLLMKPTNGHRFHVGHSWLLSWPRSTCTTESANGEVPTAVTCVGRNFAIWLELVYIRSGTKWVILRPTCTGFNFG